MANFDKILKSVTEVAGVVAEKAAGLAIDAAEKAKELAGIGKLKAEILAQKNTINKAYAEIGKIYYDYFKVDPHEPMKASCAKIDAAIAVIAAKKAEIEAIKAQDPTVAADVEDIFDDIDELDDIPELEAADEEPGVEIKVVLEVCGEAEEAKETEE